jgi:hypothetical protein
MTPGMKKLTFGSGAVLRNIPARPIVEPAIVEH